MSRVTARHEKLAGQIKIHPLRERQSQKGKEASGGSDNHLSFTDATGDMIGAWVTGRTASREPGVLPYIYVHGIDAAIDRIKANGGDVVKPPYDEGGLWVATFRDPTGNVLGIWQNGPR
jgi:predicted enzyme related to lactoylglutathione lyase